MEFKVINDKKDLSKSDKCEGYLIESSEKEARRIIESLKNSGKVICLKGGNDAFNRRAIETLKIDYLVSPEAGDKKNTLKQRDSGINHVVAKEAARKGIKIVIDFGEIQKLKGKEKALRLEKIIQNIKICKKAMCKIRIWDFSNSTDQLGLISFGISLGVSSHQARDLTKL
jgi:ribonuclease P/MRP protein subunit RPP1